MTCVECHGNLHATHRPTSCETDAEGEENLCPLCQHSKILKTKKSNVWKRIRAAADKMTSVSKKKCNLYIFQLAIQSWYQCHRLIKDQPIPPTWRMSSHRKINDVFQIACAKGICFLSNNVEIHVTNVIPEFVRLIQIILTIPVSTATCKRYHIQPFAG